MTWMRRFKMNSIAKQRGDGGLGFLSILTLIFIVLKLTEVISWSWWLVLSPIIVGAVLAIVVFIGAIIVYSRS